MQAYADDVILMSNTQEGMENMLKTVEEYCKIFKLNIAPQKCKTLSYINWLYLVGSIEKERKNVNL